MNSCLRSTSDKALTELNNRDEQTDEQNRRQTCARRRLIFIDFYMISL
ncbi:hypothetical protein CEV32_2884 [Brucella rhizosphaerae]|uniref:Uncharacterized protein n=1 Tax=Brucella rhizosphaerae TaxID=571254 RepID=A0A256F000_9HYPH|nr:hypothetical protein CEV32_2884 [Brucella rhizosphaerae]